MRRRCLLLALLALGVCPAGAAARPWIETGDVTISPDGTTLYATGERTLTFALDHSTGMPRQLSGNEPGGKVVAATPEGRFVYVAGDYNRPGIHVMRRDARSGLLTHLETFRQAPGGYAGEVRGLAVSPDGRFLYATRRPGPALVVFRIDPATGHLAPQQVVYGGDSSELGAYPAALAVAPNSVHVATDEGIESFRSDDATGRLSSIPREGIYHTGFHGLAMGPGGHRVYASTSTLQAATRDAAGRIYPLDQTADFAPVCGNLWMSSARLAVAPDHAFVVATSSDGRLLQADVTPGGLTAQRAYDELDGRKPTGLAWSRDGRFLYVAVSGAAEGQSGCPRPEYSLPGAVYVFARSGDGLRRIGVAEATEADVPNGLNAMTIDNGALYTNDLDVTLTVHEGSLWRSSLTIANRPDFTGGRTERFAGSASYRWTLEAGDPDRSVRRVYVRYTSDGTTPATTVMDDIILDRRLPVVSSARRVSRRKVSVRARDAGRSGLHRLQFARRRLRPAKPIAYRSSVRVRAGRAVWVRVIDRAGNYSKWRKVRPARKPKPTR